MKQIDALSQFNVTLISRYELDKNPSDIKERKSAERVNLKRADFICLIRLKFDEDLEPRIMNKWAELQDSKDSSRFKNWQNKLSDIRTLKTLSMGYSDSIKGMLQFWSNLLNNETLHEGLIGEINDHLRKDENYNFQTSPDFQKSPSYLLTPMHHSGESFFYR